MPPMEVVEQVDGRWNRGAEIQQEMRDHDDIGFDADDFPSPVGVRVENPAAEPGVLDIWKVHGTEDGGFEFLRFRVVNALQIRNGLLLLVL